MEGYYSWLDLCIGDGTQREQVYKKSRRREDLRRFFFVTDAQKWGGYAGILLYRYLFQLFPRYLHLNRLFDLMIAPLSFRFQMCEIV